MTAFSGTKRSILVLFSVSKRQYEKSQTNGTRAPVDQWCQETFYRTTSVAEQSSGKSKSHSIPTGTGCGRNAEGAAKLAQQSKLAEQTLNDYQVELAGLRQRKSLQDGNQDNAENQIQKLRQHIMELENSRRFRDIILEIFHRPTMLSRTIKKQYQTLATAEQSLQDEAVKTGQLQQELERQSRKCDVQSNVISNLENQQNQLFQKNDKYVLIRWVSCACK